MCLRPLECRLQYFSDQELQSLFIQKKIEELQSLLIPLLEYIAPSYSL
jgi:hypothetical protein